MAQMLRWRLRLAALLAFARAAEIAVDMGDGRMCAGEWCFDKPPEMKVSALSPPAGPVDGHTKVVVKGQGFRHFGTMMKCLYGGVLQQASLTGEPNEYIDLQKHDKMACEAPPPKTSLPSAVEVEVTLNGEDYTGDGVQFGYYLHPKIIGISPNRGSAAKTQLLTLTRSSGDDSGVWQPPQLVVGGEDMGQPMCRFEAMVEPEGRRQVQYRKEVKATVLDATELQCWTPEVNFMATMLVEV